jgi:hypothetical protein
MNRRLVDLPPPPGYQLPLARATTGKGKYGGSVRWGGLYHTLSTLSARARALKQSNMSARGRTSRTCTSYHVYILKIALCTSLLALAVCLLVLIIGYSIQKSIWIRPRRLLLSWISRLVRHFCAAFQNTFLRAIDCSVRWPSQDCHDREWTRPR